LLDIELASLRELRSIRSQFPKKPFILSAHFFEHTPPDDELASLLESMAAKKPDIIKVACRCNSSADLGRLAVLQHLNRKLPLALMGMGELGRISRTMLPLLGARLVYGWLDAPTAPGQPSVSELHKQLSQKIAHSKNVLKKQNF
jgi:3-dehydroquinate dehydratase-1